MGGVGGVGGVGGRGRGGEPLPLSSVTIFWF